MGIYTVLNEFFPPQRPPSSLKYIQYFFLAGDPCEENSSIQNCEALQSERFFLLDKRKSHGKADAYRGFLLRYWGKRSDLERINPYVGPPFDGDFA